MIRIRNSCCAFLEGPSPAKGMQNIQLLSKIGKYKFYVEGNITVTSRLFHVVDI